MPTDLPGNLTGNFHVRVLREAFRDAHQWIRRMQDRAILRRHTLKLRYWPGNCSTENQGEVLDLDWSWIQSLKKQGHDIGELRIHDNIGGNDNLRVIFYVRKTPDGGIPTIWILGVFQKKRDDLTKAQFKVFRARKTIVDERADFI